ncbi:titin isoform X1 [Maniola hyperantus]|uniref:titin isoform X1 n=2 Tax=Aphantopus hyperantus TaxID=2795564 RepID=UPI001567D3EB|nr:uncharacterized protein LOC117995333 isoform X1 [Maniola hyperantus]
MESQLSPDSENKLPTVSKKDYQWEDLRKDREAGGYPWTHLLKVPLEGEITAEDIIRETTPRRSMSREFSKSRTHSPVDRGSQKILNLDSSPGSSRKHGEEGEDEGVHIPNFSKEISLDSDDDILSKTGSTNAPKSSESHPSAHLVAPSEIPKSVSPKSILKRRIPEPPYIGVSETREKTRCCHPLVNKIKHLADKTLHKLDKTENEKSPLSKRKKNEKGQEIRQLKNSPGAVRRQKFSAIKLGDSDEMSKTMSIDTPPSRKKKEHIYEDIDESKDGNLEKSLQFSFDLQKQYNENNNNNKENDSIAEIKSNASQDPSLVTDDNLSLKADDHIMEKLYKKDDINREAILLDDEMDPDEPNVDEVFQNQKDDTRKCDDSPNITITEIIDDDNSIEQLTTIPIETSPSPSPRNTERKQKDAESVDKEWSIPNSDHEYEIIEKPPPNITYTSENTDEKQTMVKTEDELSSTTSLERKYLQHTSDEEDHIEDDTGQTNEEKPNEDLIIAEALQKDIEERFFVNTPSSASRTECEVSTSQVEDSSALENLPLKRSSRNKNSDGTENKIQQRFKEGTGKLKSQAGKLKAKLNNIRNKQFSLPERPKFKMPERAKISLPDRRKFSLPERPKFKKINLSEKLSFGDRKKFSLTNRPKFNVGEFTKFKMPELINFPSLGKKKEKKTGSNKSESTSDLQNVASVEFEAKTYPRLFGRKKKTPLTKTSSSPILNREDTPPPTFTFTRMKKSNQEESSSYIPETSEQPREYGIVDNDVNFETEIEGRKQFSTTYDFDKLDQEYVDEEENQEILKDNISSIQDVSPSDQEYTHINELNNDEFFVRPRGISRENIQVREYLSDEIRQAFNIPKNVLAVMGSSQGIKNIYSNEPEADSEFMIDDEPTRYSTEDINERDDGYYTFPPVRPSRAKRKKKDTESIKFIDDSMNASMQFSEVDLGLSEYQLDNKQINGDVDADFNSSANDFDIKPNTDLHSIHEYANDDVIEYPDGLTIQSKTLPMPPKRKKKSFKKDHKHSSLNDFNKFTIPETWHSSKNPNEDIIVYRTEHEYIVPQSDIPIAEQSPLPPRRNRSRSSRTASVCDDDRTSHGAESLILDTHLPTTGDVKLEAGIRQESPGYATVDKSYIPGRTSRRSKSKTPPARRKSNSSERKYYTVSGKKSVFPSRPPRKKSSTSLMTLNSFRKDSFTGDVTQYDEIDEPQFDEVHKALQSGAVVSKMKDRPLPPPPRPPRGPKRKKSDDVTEYYKSKSETQLPTSPMFHSDTTEEQDVVEIEVSTQTDPLPDDIDFEIGMDENLDISMTSSLRDIIDEESILGKAYDKPAKPRRPSRSVSRSEKSLKLSDPKISDYSKPILGRTSPTVILVEKRVSSPTKINEKEEILTEASLTVKHIDIDESQIPDIPPLPKSVSKSTRTPELTNVPSNKDDQAIKRVSDSCRDVQVDNLITQRLQVKDLDVGRLNVSELQATKILVSDIEGMTLNVNELDSKSGHISVSGIEFSQSVIDEIVKKFAEISTSTTPTIPPQITQTIEMVDIPRPISREEETQTESPPAETKASSPSVPVTESIEDITVPPQRPPPPDLTPLLYSYLQDIAIPSSSLQQGRSFRERHIGEFHESQFQMPPSPSRRSKRKPTVPFSESSSDENKPRPSPRRMPPQVRAHEPTITEAGAQFLRVCQNSISRTFRNIFNTFMSYISRTEDKRDAQMAMVIFLVLIAGLIMFGLSDSRTIHHHHWEFFNPPDNKQ